MRVFWPRRGAPSTVPASRERRALTICQQDDDVPDLLPGRRVHAEPLHLVVHHNVDAIQGFKGVGPGSVFMIWNIGRKESLCFPQLLEIKLSIHLISSGLGDPGRDLESLPVQALGAAFPVDMLIDNPNRRPL